MYKISTIGIFCIIFMLIGIWSVILYENSRGDIIRIAEDLFILYIGCRMSNRDFGEEIVKLKCWIVWLRYLILGLEKAQVGNVV